jgi:hypothetical protein
MDGWSRAYRACQNCGTTRRAHVSKAYCGLCIRQMRAIWNAELWNRRRRDTLKACRHPDLAIRTPGLDSRRIRWMRKRSSAFV